MKATDKKATPKSPTRDRSNEPEARPQLAGKVAVVTGASRGVGKGIAWELGCAGATVYVTGRSVDRRPTGKLPGTVEETARLVTEAGGKGIAVACDHTRDEDVAALAETVRQGHGRVDVLVNNVWGGYEDYDPKLFTLPVWEQPLWRWDRMQDTGVRGHYTATRALAPLMIEGSGSSGTPKESPSPGGRLVVSTSSGDSGRFMGDIQYDLAKAAVERLALGFAKKLWSHGIAALAIQPGFTLTEAVAAAATPEQLAETHSPRFVGRAVVALATDPELLQLSGGVYKVGELARRYGFTDVDGSQPEPWRMPDGYDEPRLPVES